ncbi:hypothetical protein DBV15_09253 [Temnothorax longispinosus]|uniref:Uncharacterized protein n=1 Tax=Temnothorax longispinosus TaxID=300112 RepID=A0A4S2KR41_9HYME|nr:hypothetical protein DBV15_09253 [Temnothorax longispinosus]
MAYENKKINRDERRGEKEEKEIEHVVSEEEEGKGREEEGIRSVASVACMTGESKPEGGSETGGVRGRERNSKEERQRRKGEEGRKEKTVVMKKKVKKRKALKKRQGEGRKRS